MASCPACKAEVKEDATHCSVCGEPLTNEEGWVTIGSVDTRITADFVFETLKSYEIPAVVLSRSGYFGNFGLTLQPFYSAGHGLFDISVPASHKEEAEDIFKMVTGKLEGPATDQEEQ